ncbi:hypothetical protein [Thermomonospora echinospora]|nr:hypothetical protein [Thermomonospora echinospora]
MAGRVPHGVAGMLVVLFALAGVAFSYGLGGHTPPLRFCLVHAQEPGDRAPVGPGIVAQDQAHPAPGHPRPAPGDACLSLAVLLTLMVLALAAVPRPRGVRPRRFGWTLVPPARAPSRPRPLAVLQVLRL